MTFGQDLTHTLKMIRRSQDNPLNAFLADEICAPKTHILGIVGGV